MKEPQTLRGYKILNLLDANDPARFIRYTKRILTSSTINEKTFTSPLPKTEITTAI